MRRWLGSIAFTTILFVSVAVYGLVVLALGIFGYRSTYAGCRLWARMILGLLRVLCGLDFSVRGLERLPDENGIILMKHSSSWETIAQLVLFPRQTWVMKRELIWAPILGWVIFLLKPIPIDRKGGRTAVEQVIRVGRQRLEQGFWVVIFPEGTRVPAGQTGRFGMSGVLLARAAGRPIVPVAHNAGYYWPRRGLLKRSGTIQVVVGEPIPTAERDPREVNAEVKAWIETEIAAMAKPAV
ncbi:MAG: lysophospholipid acyltransferase family protein [Gammaproteobacteria bacterium]|jgi:1-acyl-sn-glycerol-3-phosphate acyltransferase